MSGAVIHGIAAYALIAFTLLYAAGSLGIPKAVDFGVAGPWGQSLVIDMVLLALFAVQHSAMARKAFNRWWTRLEPPSAKRTRRSSHALSHKAV